MEYFGEVAGLGTALCFALSSLSFGLAGRKAGGLAVNQFRVCAAVVALALWQFLATGQWWPDADANQIALLVGSGIVGLAIGDLALFYALAVIGPRISSVLMATSPSMALAVLFCWHGTVPRWEECLGVAVTSIGVVLVLLRQQDGSAWNPNLNRALRTRAVLAGLLGSLGQAVGLVMAHAAMLPATDIAEPVPALGATLVRLLAGCGGIMLVGLLAGHAAAWRKGVQQKVVGHTLAGTLTGPILGVWLSMVAVQQLGAGIASALFVTTPLFLLPITRVAYGAKVGWQGLLGTVLTVAGAVVLVLLEK